MNIQPTNQPQSISDDQELAKVLAGVNNQTDDTVQSEATLPEPAVPPTPMPGPADEVVEEPQEELTEQPEVAAPAESLAQPVMSAGDSSLEGIKLEALGELRPLVDKLDVSPEEKFDTYLLLLRSTDDKELIAPAHDAAKAITDEARRAQALLDIIKEIDFLSNGAQQK